MESAVARRSKLQARVGEGERQLLLPKYPLMSEEASVETGLCPSRLLKKYPVWP
jgi:hypothetical protein